VTQYPYLKQPTPAEAKYARPDLPTCCYVISSEIELGISIFRDRPELRIRWSQEPEVPAVSVTLIEAHLLARVLRGDYTDAPQAPSEWWDWFCRGWVRQSAKLSLGSNLFVFLLEGNQLAIANSGLIFPAVIRLDPRDAFSLRTALDQAFGWLETALQNRSRLSG